MIKTIVNSSGQFVGHVVHFTEKPGHYTAHRFGHAQDSTEFPTMNAAVNWLWSFKPKGAGPVQMALKLK